MTVVTDETGPLRSTAWLADRLGDPTLRIVDGSFHLPTAGRNPKEEFVQRHIPGAVFFDIDAIADGTSHLPHMLPSADTFAERVGALGIGSSDTIVAYDAPGSAAAARIWWTFRVFGHNEVAILDGGLARWLAEGRPVEDGMPSPSRRPFRARLQSERVITRGELVQCIGIETVVDARGPGRFRGDEPEPRPAKRCGHVPGARNLPFMDFLDPDRHGGWRSPDEIAGRFATAGVDPSQPFIAYCGSGVTACVPAFAAYLLGHDRARIYDGSWAEWGNCDDTPIERG
ncbi:MAG: sulfurtransferase [Rhodospirillales bacterium]